MPDLLPTKNSEVEILNRPKGCCVVHIDKFDEVSDVVKSKLEFGLRILLDFNSAAFCWAIL